MTLKIWPYEVKTTCDSCRDECEPNELWHLFAGESPTGHDDIVCVRCIPATAWSAWESDQRAADAANIMEWLVDGSPDCVAAADKTLAEVRERDALSEMRQQLVEHNLDSRTFENPAVERAARNSVAGGYRTWTRQQLEEAVAKLPTPRRCPDCGGSGMDERDEGCRRCGGTGEDS